MSRYDVRPMLPADYVDATQGRAPWEPSAWDAGCYRLDHGDAWTARVDDQIAAVGGCIRIWPGVGDVWLCLTPVGQAHPVFIVRQVARHLAEQVQRHGLRRVQADVQDHDVRALDLLIGGAEGWKGLGFKEEGIMVRYGPRGEDFIRCALIP